MTTTEELALREEAKELIDRARSGDLDAAETVIGFILDEPDATGDRQ